MHRRDLAWRHAYDSYRILVSEVMLQQTRADRVVPKYHKFLKAFPTIASLARAPLASVLRMWQELGYNRRALHLSRTARAIMREYDGKIPSSPEVLTKLPGIGPGTAGAIAAFAFGKRVAFLETNIRRVYLHFFFPRKKNVRDSEILAKIGKTLPRRDVREWYYALMDYGACTLVLKGIRNPNWRSAHYLRQPRFPGSRREVRGRIVKEVLSARALSFAELAGRLDRERRFRRFARKKELVAILNQLAAEGLIVRRNGAVLAAR